MHPTDSSPGANLNRKSFGRISEPVEESSLNRLPTYRFGKFLLNLQLRRLSEGEKIVPLQQKPFRVLVHLIENRNRVVSRTELIDLFWEGQQAYQDSLRRAVSAVRNALKDKREHPRFLETHHGEGYRFIAVVEEAGRNPSASGANRPRVNPSAPEVDSETDAVLAPDAQLSSLRNSWGGSLPPARSASHGISLRSAGVLGIAAVLLFTAASLVRHVSRTHRTLTLSAPRVEPPQDGASIDAYREAQYLLSQRSSQTIQQAIEIFNGVLRANPHAGDAYAGLAECYGLGYWGFWKIDPELAVAKSDEYARKAVQLDSGSGYAHTQLAAALLRQLRIHDAQTEFELALAIRPNDAEVHHAYAIFLDDTHRADSGIQEMKRAINIQPLSLAYKTDLGMSYFFAKRYADAIAQYKSVLKLDTGYIEAHEYLASMYVYQAEWTQARTEYAAIDRLRGGHGGDFGQSPLRLITEFKTGHQGRARMGVEAIRASSSIERFYSLARIYAQLGRSGEALQYLTQVVNSHSPEMFTVPDDPLLSPLHGNPKFETLAGQVSAVFTGSTEASPIQAAALTITGKSTITRIIEPD